MRPEARARIIADYRAGMKWKDLVAKHDVAWSTLAVVLRESGEPRTRKHDPAVLIEDLDYVIGDGITLTAALKRFDIKEDALWRICKRRGRLDLFDRLADREPGGELRRATREGIRRAKEVA